MIQAMAAYRLSLIFDSRFIIVTSLVLMTSVNIQPVSSLEKNLAASDESRSAVAAAFSTSSATVAAHFDGDMLDERRQVLTSVEDDVGDYESDSVVFLNAETGDVDDNPHTDAGDSNSELSHLTIQEKGEGEEEGGGDEDEEEENCPSEHFYNVVEKTCQPCSSCTANEIVRRRCSQRRDTVCGPFFEFDQFLQHPVEGPGGERDGSQHPSGHGQSHPNGCKHDSRNKAGTVPGEKPDLTSEILNEAGIQWRTLSLALITVLAIICCIVVFVGVYVCVTCRRARHHKYFDQPGLLPGYRHEPESDEPRYVETYFASSRDRLRTSRHLPVYQPIYTGSRLLPPLTTSLGTNVTSQSSCTTRDAHSSDHEYIYINFPDDVDNRRES